MPIPHVAVVTARNIAPAQDSIRLTGIPESVRALSELYEIKDWLKS